MSQDTKKQKVQVRSEKAEDFHKLFMGYINPSARTKHSLQEIKSFLKKREDNFDFLAERSIHGYSVLDDLIRIPISYYNKQVVQNNRVEFTLQKALNIILTLWQPLISKLSHEQKLSLLSPRDKKTSNILVHALDTKNKAICKRVFDFLTEFSSDELKAPIPFDYDCGDNLLHMSVRTGSQEVFRDYMLPFLLKTFYDGEQAQLDKILLSINKEEKNIVHLALQTQNICLCQAVVSALEEKFKDNKKEELAAALTQKDTHGHTILTHAVIKNHSRDDVAEFLFNKIIDWHKEGLIQNEDIKNIVLYTNKDGYNLLHQTFMTNNVCLINKTKSFLLELVNKNILSQQEVNIMCNTKHNGGFIPSQNSKLSNVEGTINAIRDFKKAFSPDKRLESSSTTPPPANQRS